MGFKLKTRTKAYINTLMVKLKIAMDVTEVETELPIVFKFYENAIQFIIYK
jgi:hypothetical protein